MKRSAVNTILFILLAVVAAGLSILWLSQKRPRRFDPTVTLSYRDKRPYGAYIAYQELPNLFPRALFTLSRRSDAFLQDLEDSDRHQVMFILTRHFYANAYEWNTLIRWVRQGNYLVVSSERFSQEVKDNLHVQLSNLNLEDIAEEMVPPGVDDTLSLGLNQPPFADSNTFIYPGRRMDRAIVSMDSSFAEALGTNDLHYANLIHIRAGEGAVLVQTAPLAFSNYFLLYKHNIRYFEQVWSLLPRGINKVIWNEYYLYRQQDDNNGFAGALSKLLKDPALGPAFLILLLILVVFALLEMKRGQRIIPEIRPPANESLDFVKTIGRLYHDKGDNLNLAVKMGQHFLEYTRNRYQVKPDLGDESSMRRLASRSGVSEEVVKGIATHIRYVHDAPELSVDQLEELYSLLETFYNTAQ